MDTEDKNLADLPTTSEIGALMGLNKADDHTPTHTQPSPGNLPVVEGEFDVVRHEQGLDDAQEKTVDSALDEPTDAVVDMETGETISEPELELQKLQLTRRIFRPMKTALPYIAAFGIGLFLYFFYFSNFSFTDIFKTNAAQVTSNSEHNRALLALEKSRSTDYNNWIMQFYVEVTDSSITDPNRVTCSGLTNFESYLLNLNPKVCDTLGDGKKDGAKLVDGNDPITGQPLNGDRKAIVDKYFDLQSISDRLASGAADQANANNQSSGVNPLSFGARNFGATSASSSGLINATQSNSGDSPTFPAQPSGTTVKPSASAASPTVSLGGLDINTSVAGTIKIPSIGVTVPVIWSKNVSNFDADLVKGAVHYPGTAMPGEPGNAYISAHSSALPWVKSPYKNIFAKFPDLHDGDSFTVTVTLKDGTTRILHYVIRSHGIYETTDQAQFVNTAKSTVTLSTCWPIGTASKRLNERAELTQIEN